MSNTNNMNNIISQNLLEVSNSNKKDIPSNQVKNKKNVIMYEFDIIKTYAF